MVEKCIIFGCLFVGFLLLFRRIRWMELLRQLMKQTQASMDEASRQRLLQSRKTLQSIQKEQSVWLYAERQLQYSGLKRRFPFLTAERWIAGNTICLSLLFCGLHLLPVDGWLAPGVTIAMLGAEMLGITVLKAKAMRSVERNLLKFLDFLGNYSITAGEVTGIFNQVSKYMEEPLRGVLNECYYEAQTTGDASMALLSMAEKVEHPKFKELVRNIEISIRYSADFTALVHSSRRSVREYLRTGGERKNMLREAAVNMMLLLALSGFIMLTVDGLIEQSVWHILFFSLPGRVALGAVLVIFLLFARQIYKLNQ